jgi:predicted N-formylglutamate amidohydrolase
MSQILDAMAFGEANVGLATPWLLAVDHASNRIPTELGQLGLRPAELERHIAYDIGALAVAHLLAELLPATVIWSQTSRLVIDCNRPLASPNLIPPSGDEGIIPANQAVSQTQREWRIGEFWQPYHQRIEAILEQRQQMGIRTHYIAVHSMTPKLGDNVRSMDGAVLYRAPSRFGIRLAHYMRKQFGLVIAENEPYQLTDQTDYSVPFHAERRGLEYLEFEMRQDLITDAEGQQLWAHRLCEALTALERQ